MKSLEVHDGWKILVDIARKQMAAREVHLWAPMPSGDAIYNMEFMKGERAGIDLFLRMPEVLAETAKVTIDAELEKPPQEQEEEDGQGS